MTEEIKPCPFCGKQPVITLRQGDEVNGYRDVVTIGCCVEMWREDEPAPKKDWARYIYSKPGTGRAAVIAAWNTRNG